MSNKIKDDYAYWILLDFFITKPITYLIPLITRFFPFSLLFTSKLFHANWIGANRIIKMVGFTSIICENNFKADEIDRDEHNFYVFGKFKKEPSNQLFEDLQRLAKDDGLEIRYCGKFESGRHKFMAPVKQNWTKWVWY